MNAPPERVTLTPTECGDCGGSLAQAFPQSTLYLRCRRCGHVTPANLAALEAALTDEPRDTFAYCGQFHPGSDAEARVYHAEYHRD